MTTKVASIYFAPVKAERNFGGPFTIPAVPLGADPYILYVKDCVQVEEGPYQLGINGKRAKRRFHIYGEDIARDIVGEWTAHGLGMTPQCRPGIWVVRERVPLLNEDGSQQRDADGRAMWREASAEEAKRMWEEDLYAARVADKAYAEVLLQQGDEMYSQDKRLRRFISPVAKLAVAHYGLSAEWAKPAEQIGAPTPCPYCTRMILQSAIKCPHCNEVVNVEEYARMEVERKAAMRKHQFNAELKAGKEREAKIDPKLLEEEEKRRQAKAAKKAAVSEEAVPEPVEIAPAPSEEPVGVLS